MTGKNLVTWILVGDDRRARIFRNMGGGSGLKLIFERASGDKHKSVKSQRSENKGLFGIFSSADNVKKTIVETVPSDEKFYPWVTKRINASGEKDKFDVLVIIAPQGVSDNYVESLSPKVVKKLHSQLSKDLTRAGATELENYLSVVIDL